MTKRSPAATSALAVLLLAPGPLRASNGDIGLFFDPSAAICQQVLPCGETAVIYVYALLEGASHQGILSAEYKVQIGPDHLTDPGWLFAENFDPNAVAIGSGAFTPPDAGTAHRGVVVAWPGCVTG